MTTKPASINRDKASYWQEKIAAWKRSGLKQSDFCDQHNLRFTTFGYWRSRLLAQRKPSEERVLVPVEIKSKKPPLSMDVLRIKLPNGVCVECSSGLSEVRLKLLLSVLGVTA